MSNYCNKCRELQAEIYGKNIIIQSHKMAQKLLSEVILKQEKEIAQLKDSNMFKYFDKKYKDENARLSALLGACNKDLDERTTQRNELRKENEVHVEVRKNNDKEIAVLQMRVRDFKEENAALKKSVKHWRDQVI